MAKRPHRPIDGDHDPKDADAGTAEYSSPACYAHEVDPNYFMPPPPMPAEELVAFLNTLLEAERAGAKTIAYYLKDAGDGPVREALQSTGRDEARYTALLRRLVERLGGSPSDATGAFYEKARALEDEEERLAFLNRGQGWVARKLDEVLPRIADREILEALTEMRDTHLENIARCAEAGRPG